MYRPVRRVTPLRDEFSPEVLEVIQQGLELNDQLPAAQAEVERILTRRRAAILRARVLGVSGYRLAEIFAVSQTTIANWSR